MGQLTREQIAQMGFASVGDEVFLFDKASFYNCQNIRLGSRVRIDDFCVLAAGEGGFQCVADRQPGRARDDPARPRWRP